MSSSTGSSRRSGDPRKRAAAGSSASAPSPVGRRWVVAPALVVSVALVSLAAAAARPDERRSATAGSPAEAAGVDARALMHAEVACDLTSKAGRSAGDSHVAERVRYAAAVLLLDQAIIESARAARTNPLLAPLDDALREVHTAGHEGDHRSWRLGLRSADAECHDVLR